MANYRRNLFGGLSWNMGESLALVTFLNKVRQVFLHHRLVIPLSEGILRQTSLSWVVTINAFVNFPHYILNLIWLETSQVRHGISPLIHSVVQDCVPIGLVLDPSSFILIFRSLSFWQERKDWDDLAWWEIDRHNVVRRFSCIGLN